MQLEPIPKSSSNIAQQYLFSSGLSDIKDTTAAHTPYIPLVLKTDVQDATAVDKPKEPIETIPKLGGSKKKKRKPAETAVDTAAPADTMPSEPAPDATPEITPEQPAEQTPDASAPNEQKSLAAEIMAVRNAQLAADSVDDNSADKNTRADRGKHGFSLLGFLRPSDEELDAQANGMRWHHEMENGWMLSPQWQKTVFAGVDREKQANAERSAESARAKEARQRRYQNGWDKMITAWEHGHWDDKSREYNELREAMMQFRNDAIARGVDTSSWQIPGITAGQVANAQKQSLIKLQNDIVSAEQAYDDMVRYSEKLKSGTMTEKDRANFLATFDKRLEDMVRIVSGVSGGSLADAEKIRIQYQALPPAMKTYMENERQKFFNALAGNMRYLSSNAKSAETTNKLAKALAQLKPGSSTDFGTALTNTLGVLTSILSDKDELAIGTTTDEVIAQYKHLMDSIMQYAIVDPNIMMSFIKQAYDLSYSKLQADLWTANRQVDLPERRKMNADMDDLSKYITDAAMRLKLGWANPSIARMPATSTHGNVQAEADKKTKPANPAEFTDFQGVM